MMEEKIPKKWAYVLVALLLAAGAIAVWRSLREPRASPEPFAPLGAPIGGAERQGRVQSLEREVTELRRELEDRSGRMSGLTTELAETKRELAIARERLEQARRERDQLAAAAAPSNAREAPGRSEAPSAKESRPPKEPEPVDIWRRPAEPGTYEAIRTTTVFDGPSRSGRKVATIAQGTRVTVVGSRGEWLEVRSRHGNPPGFVHRGDAMFVKAED